MRLTYLKNKHPVGVISSALVLLTHLCGLIYFFATAEYSGTIQFRRIIAPSTGEPMSIVLSLILYILLGWLLWLLFGIGVGMFITWPVGMMGAIFSKGKKTVEDSELDGVLLSMRVFPFVLVICGLTIVFGIVVV